MPLQLREYEFNIPRPGIGQARALASNPEIHAAIQAIKHDIFLLVDAHFEFTEETINLLLASLTSLRVNILRLPPRSTSYEQLSQQLRFLVLVLKNRFDFLSLNDRGKLNDILITLSQNIGIIPELNSGVRLPDPEFMPPNYQKTVKKWAAIPWTNPKRGVLSKEAERLYFFDKDNAPSVRAHLQKIDQNKKYPEEALSYVDADFFEMGDLHADHFQPSEDIIARQQELVAAMNLDPLFAERMKKLGKGKGYFLEENGEIFGSKKFFMEYHNCIDNLWLIRTAVGLRKSDQDPIEWLKNHQRFGEVFLNDIGGESSICKSSIFWTTREGTLLAEATRQWFLKKYRSEIVKSRLIRREILDPIDRQASVLPQASKKRNIRVMTKIAVASVVVEESDDTYSGENSNNDSDSIDSDRAEFSEDNFEEIKKMTLRRRAQIREAVDETTQEYTRVSKKPRLMIVSKSRKETTEDEAIPSKRQYNLRR